MGVYLIISFIMTAIGMKLFIFLLEHTKLLRRKEAAEIIKKSCIQELHKSKLKTPTMGGIVMNIIFFLMTLSYYFIYKTVLWVNFLMLLFGIMGYVDDYIKIKKVRDGVTPKEKLVGLTVISLVVVMYLIVCQPMVPVIIIPFLLVSWKINVVVYGLFMVMILVATSNSANITDGLDGLILGISSIVLVFIGIVAWQLNQDSILFSVVVLLGTCLGAYVFNRHPAKIFIGDTGSLFLGGAIAVLMIQLNIPLWIVLVLIVCLWEAISVILQLTSIKLRGKRVFKIAPYHHHLESCGWRETKIVYVFWIVTAAFCALGYFGLGGI